MLATDTDKGFLSEKTLIPLSFVVTLGAIVFWASTLAARIDTTTGRVAQLESQEEMIVKMREDVARISTRVDMIYDKVKQ